MELFILIHDPNGDRVASYVGMSQATITSLQSFPFDFIDGVTYSAFLAAHQLISPTPAQILAAQRTSAIDTLLNDPNANSKAFRAILLTLLDQINTIRAALPSPLVAITPAQAKAAVQAKINSGAPD